MNAKKINAFIFFNLLPWMVFLLTSSCSLKSQNNSLSDVRPESTLRGLWSRFGGKIPIVGEYSKFNHQLIFYDDKTFVASFEDRKLSSNTYTRVQQEGTYVVHQDTLFINLEQCNCIFQYRVSPAKTRLEINLISPTDNSMCFQFEGRWH